MACPLLALGGAQTWTLDLCRALDPGRIEVVGLAYDADRGDAGERERAEKVATVGIGRDAVLELSRAVDRLIVWGFDHPVGDLSRAIVLSHGVGFWSRRTCKWAGRALASVAVSRSAGEVFPSGVLARVIENAVDPVRLWPKHTRPSTRSKWGVPDDAKVLGYLGRLSDEKGLDRIIAAAEHLPEDWRVVLVGHGFLEEKVRDWRYESPARERIVLPGPTDDPGAALDAFDVYGQASIEEGFGLSVAEAMTVGVPVIATPTGIAGEFPGLVRTIPTGAQGPDIARAAVETLEDPGIDRVVDEARSLALSRWSPERFGREWTEFLAGPARKDPGPHPHLRAAETCPSRGPCSCRGYRCRGGRRDGQIVTLKDCLDCVEAYGTPED